MRYLTVIGVLILALSVSAFGQIIDPNVGFCDPVATATGCSGQPETNPIGSSTTFGMWSFGANDANTPWYLLVSVPQTVEASITAPSITSSDFTLSFTTSAYFTPSSSGSIYDLFSQTMNLGGNSSMNATNMFGSLEQAAFGGTPADFDVLLYTVTPGFNGSTPYSFSSAPGLINGTFLAAIGVGGNNNNIQFSTPFTTSGLVDAPPSVPDGGMTLMLLGGALVGLEALRRRLRV